MENVLKIVASAVFFMFGIWIAQNRQSPYSSLGSQNGSRSSYTHPLIRPTIINRNLNSTFELKETLIQKVDFSSKIEPNANNPWKEIPLEKSKELNSEAFKR